MKVTVIPIVIGALSTVTKGLVQGLKDLAISRQAETILIAELLRSARVLRRVLETCGDMISFRFQGKTISYCWCKNLPNELHNSDKRFKNLDLCRELKNTPPKKLKIMKMTVILIVTVLDTISKRLVKGIEDLEIRGRVESIQTTGLLWSVRILGRFLEAWGDLLSFKIKWKTINKCWCEKALKGFDKNKSLGNDNFLYISNL